MLKIQHAHLPGTSSAALSVLFVWSFPVVKGLLFTGIIVTKSTDLEKCDHTLIVDIMLIIGVITKLCQPFRTISDTSFWFKNMPDLNGILRMLEQEAIPNKESHIVLHYVM